MVGRGNVVIEFYLPGYFRELSLEWLRFCLACMNVQFWTKHCDNYMQLLQCTADDSILVLSV